MLARFLAPMWAKVLSGALVVALIFGGIQTYRAGYWKRVATVLRLDLDKIKLASELAGERAKAAKAETEKQYREAAERTEREYSASLDRARAAARAYALNHRVRAKAPESISRRTNQAGQGASAQLPAESPGASDMVAITERDLEIAAENHAYAQAAYEWTQELIKQGLAEPASRQ